MAGSCFKVAHLSDVHLLAPERDRRDSATWSVRLASIGRSLNGPERAQKLRRAIALAKKMGADHLVVSGDLTETGTRSQFEHFAEILHESAFDRESISLVPGNHDAYDSPTGWRDALRGPLSAFARTSSHAPGVLIERGDVCFVPIDTTQYQAITSSAGIFSNEAATALELRLRDPAMRNKSMVVVQHHPPITRPSKAWQWVDGLRGWAKLIHLLDRFPGVQLMHGHWHEIIDRAVGLGRSHIFGATATVADKRTEARIRLYELRNGRLESSGLITG